MSTDLIHNDNQIAVLTRTDEYIAWLQELKSRYLSIRLKASIQVTQSVLSYYWSVGRDIAEKQYANTYGSTFYKRLSEDLRKELPHVKGLSERNLRYMYDFYILYNQVFEILPQSAAKLDDEIMPQNAANSLFCDLCSIPWDHHRRIIDKCKGNPEKALFFVHKTLENNWSRDVLINFLGTNLFEREGRAITNFNNTLPEVQGDLAQQITKDPYNFDFLTLRENYDEKELEDALVENVTRFLLELGTGFSYMGRQFPLTVGSKEFFPDLLFYNTRLHAYCVVELKVTSFKPEYLGQLGFYVSTINHQFKTELDNPTIGLLICRDKDNVVAQYSLESSSQPIGISEYQLSKIYPVDFKSTMPTIEEIEAELAEHKDK